MLPLLVSLFLFQGGPEEASRLEQAAAQAVAQEPGEAVELLRRALAILEAQDAPDRTALARVLNGLAYAQSLSGEPNEALVTGERALAVARAEADPSPMTAAVLRNLAEIAEQAGRLAVARSYADGAVADLEAAYGINPTAAEFREYAGRLAMQAGDGDAAMRHLVMALGIYERLFQKTNRERSAGPMQGLAMVFAAEGWFDAAFDLHDRALRLLEQSGQTGSPLWATHLASRRTLLAELGETRLARADLARWLASVAPQVPPDQVIEARLDWAATWLSLGDPRRAREQLDQASGRQAPEQAARRLLLEAQCLAQEGRWRQALERADAATSAFAESAPDGSRPVVTELEWVRARALRELGEPEQAFAGLLELYHSIRGVWGEGAARLTPTCLELLAAELPAHGVSAELIDFLDFVESCAARAQPRDLAALQNQAWTAWRRSAWAPAVRGWLHLADSRPEKLSEAFAALDRCRERALLAANAWWIATGAARRDETLSGLLQTLGALADQPMESEAGQRLQQQLGDRMAALRRTRNPWTPYLDPVGVDLEKARAALDDGQVLVCYHWSDPEAWAVVIGPDRAQDRVIRLGATAELQPALGRAMRALGDPGLPCDLAPLAGKLLHPLWAQLEGRTSAVIVADGPLAFLPFAALPDPDGSPWVTHCRISHAPTVRGWLERPKAADEGRRGSIHLTMAPPEEGGSPRGNQIQRLRTRIPDDHEQRLVSALDGQADDQDLIVSTELALKEADREGKTQGRRLLEIRAPAWIDAEVPSATAVVTSPGLQGEDLSSWEREDGVIGMTEWRDLSLAVDAVVLWQAQAIPRNEDLRHEGLHELVASLWAGGGQSVLLSGWAAASDAAVGFDRVLREELSRGDPAGALAKAQRRWLRENRDRPELLDPGIWARMRLFGR